MQRFVTSLQAARSRIIGLQRLSQFLKDLSVADTRFTPDESPATMEGAAVVVLVSLLIQLNPRAQNVSRP